jgi:hypothetical protein
MSDQKPENPQDADATATLSTSSTQHLPAHQSAAWTTWVPESAHEPHASTVAAPTTPPEPKPSIAPATATPTPAPAGPPAQPAWQPPPRQQVTYLPPPGGPNWGLVVFGVIVGLVGAGIVANQVAGFQVSSLSELGPSVLVIAGLACALLGIVGILTRRRRG